MPPSLDFRPTQLWFVTRTMPDRQNIDRSGVLVNSINQSNGWHGKVANVVSIEGVESGGDERVFPNQLHLRKNAFAEPPGSVRIRSAT